LHSCSKFFCNSKGNQPIICDVIFKKTLNVLIVLEASSECFQSLLEITS